MMKKNIANNISTIILFILSFCVCVVLLCGCENPWYNKQSYLRKVVWQSENNEYNLSISFLAWEGGNYGYIDYCGERKEIVMHWGNLWFELCLVTHYGEDVSNGYKYNPDIDDYEYYPDVPQYVVSGGYKILKGKKSQLKVQLSIGCDTLFNGELVGKVVTVVSHKVNPVDYGIGDHRNVEWKNSEDNISLITSANMKNFSVGTYSGIKVVTYWLDKDRFSMYELVDNVQQDIDLACGSYIYTGKTVTLNFEKNNITTQKTITLTGKDSLVFCKWYPPNETSV